MALNCKDCLKKKTCEDREKLETIQSQFERQLQIGIHECYKDFRVDISCKKWQNEYTADDRFFDEEFS